MAKTEKRPAWFKVSSGLDGRPRYRLDGKFAGRVMRLRGELAVCARVLGEQTAAGGTAGQAAATLANFLRLAGFAVVTAADMPERSAGRDGKAAAAGEGGPA